jgi:arabinan endo-1,5-alpha-L-arabinosidase
LDLYACLDNNCHKFNLERAANGSLIFTSLNGSRVVEVLNASTADGVRFSLFDYNGATCQQWSLGTAGVQ